MESALAKSFAITQEVNTPIIPILQGERWRVTEVKLCPGQAAGKWLSQIWREGTESRAMLSTMTSTLKIRCFHEGKRLYRCLG